MPHEQSSLEQANKGVKDNNRFRLPPSRLFSLPPLPPPIAREQSVLLQRYLAIINVPSTAETSKDSDTTANGSGNGSSTFGGGKNKLSGSSSSGTKDAASVNSSANSNGSAANASANASAGANSAAATAAGTPGRVRMETNFYVLATACLLLANKSLRARVGSAKPRRREELLRAAYGVQFRGRTVEKGTVEAVKWEGKLATAELEVLVALRFDVHLTDPFEALDQQRGQQVGLFVVVVVVFVVVVVIVVVGAVGGGVIVDVGVIAGSGCCWCRCCWVLTLTTIHGVGVL